VVNFPLAASMAFSFRAASRAASVAEPVLGAGVSHLLRRFRPLQNKQEKTRVYTINYFKWIIFYPFFYIKLNKKT
jgi:hypothetical protein